MSSSRTESHSFEMQSLKKSVPVLLLAGESRRLTSARVNQQTDVLITPTIYPQGPPVLSH